MELRLFSTLACIFSGIAQASDLTPNQQLIASCHRVHIDGVVQALRAGAKVDSRYGEGQCDALRNPWTGGLSIAYKEWTPLLALASGSLYPDPQTNASELAIDAIRMREEQLKIPSTEVALRARNRTAILMVLLSHNADIDADDGYGATPLYKAIYEKHEEMAKILLQYGANVNTRTKPYIDGPGNVTPLHRALWSPTLTESLLKRGANPTAVDTSGESPLDWAVKAGEAPVVRVYKEYARQRP